MGCELTMTLPLSPKDARSAMEDFFPTYRVDKPSEKGIHLLIKPSTTDAEINANTGQKIVIKKAGDWGSLHLNVLAGFNTYIIYVYEKSM